MMHIFCIILQRKAACFNGNVLTRRYISLPLLFHQFLELLEFMGIPKNHLKKQELFF